MGYGEAPWEFTGRALYQLSLVRVEEVRQCRPLSDVRPPSNTCLKQRLPTAMLCSRVQHVGCIPSICSSSSRQARKYVPPELPLVNFFGWTIGGFYLARYSCGLAVNCSPFACRDSKAASHSATLCALIISPPHTPPPAHPPPHLSTAQPPRWVPSTSAWPWRVLPGTGRRRALGQPACM